MSELLSGSLHCKKNIVAKYFTIKDWVDGMEIHETLFYFPEPYYHMLQSMHCETDRYVHFFN